VEQNGVVKPKAHAFGDDTAEHFVHHRNTRNPRFRLTGALTGNNGQQLSFFGDCGDRTLPVASAASNPSSHNFQGRKLDSKTKHKMANIVISESEQLKINAMEEATAASARRSSFISDEVSSLLQTSSQASVKQFATRLSVISKNYDLDGDGVLDEARKALRKMDGGDGNLDKTAVYKHIQ
jgi:hypothetical protein